MNNLDRLQQKLRATDLDAFLVTDMANVRWVSGFTGTFGHVLVGRHDARFLTDSRYTLQAKEQVAGMPAHSFANPKKAVDLIAEQVAELEPKRLGFESRHVVVDTYQAWCNRLEDVELVPVPDLIGPIRAVKTPDEIARLRRACKLTDELYEHLVGFLRVGVTELEVRDEAERYLKERGAEAGYPPIVVSGERSARPHGVPSDKKLEKGDLVTMDIGARVDGYTADITRTVVMGKATERQREVYEQVLKAEVAACGMLVPGANGRDIDRRAREILDEKELARYFGHGLGHGLGALVHDAGRLSPTEDQPIETGQVWTVEPGVYIEGFGGVRIEDDVLVTDSDPEILTHFNRELVEIER
jgi:Xaa-Pro aminopeptidase